jgi:hypothetical protein
VHSLWPFLHSQQPAIFADRLPVSPGLQAAFVLMLHFFAILPILFGVVLPHAGQSRREVKLLL